MINKKKHRLSIKTRFDTQMDCPSKTGTNNSDAIRQNLINVLISYGYKISMIFASLIDNTKYFRPKMNDPAASTGGQSEYVPSAQVMGTKPLSGCGGLNREYQKWKKNQERAMKK
jgi:hypothetical protein